MSQWLSLPNLHPAVVHFPIALLPTALLLDLAAIVYRRLRSSGEPGIDWLARAASVLYVVAALAAFAALSTGEDAADSYVDLPAVMQPRIAAHSDAAHWAAYLLVAVAALHLLVRFLERQKRSDLARGALALLAFSNVVVVARTADLGGALVYRHGLGVVVEDGTEAGTRPSTEPATTEPPVTAQPPAEDLAAARARLHADEQTGPGLDWRPMSEDGALLYQLVDVGSGFSRTAATWKEERPARGKEAAAGLPLQISGATLLLLPGEFGDVQLEAHLQLEGFSGTVGLAHHVRGAQQRGVFVLGTTGEASLVDLRDGTWTVLDEDQATTATDSLELAVSAAGRHLKGTIDGATVVHGHASAPEAGRCGLFFDGEGAVRIVSVRIIPL
jgi:uncharacterized membrane protein